MKQFLQLLFCLILIPTTLHASQLSPAASFTELEEVPTYAKLQNELGIYQNGLTLSSLNLNERLEGPPQEKALRIQKAAAIVTKLTERMKAKQKIRAFKAILLMTNDNEKSAWEVKHEILQEILKETKEPSLVDKLFRNHDSMDHEAQEGKLIKDVALNIFAVQQQQAIIQAIISETRIETILYTDTIAAAMETAADFLNL